MRILRDFLVLGFVLTIGQCLAQTNLTFEEAMQLTKQQSHVIKQTDFLKQEKEQELKSAYGTFSPTIALAGNYVYMSDELHMDMTQIKDAITPIYKGLQYAKFSDIPNPQTGTPLPEAISTMAARGKFAEGLEKIESAEWDKVLQKQQFAALNLTASLPIYTGGKLRAKRHAAKLDIDDANYESKSKIDKLTTELVTRYFGLGLAKQLHKLSTEVVSSMEQHLSDAQKLKENGMIANAEVLNVQVYKAEAERNMKKAERMCKLNNKALSTTLNDSTERNIYPISKLFYLDNLESLEFFVKTATTNNPSLKIVQSKKELANLGVKVKRADYMPTIVALGNYKVWDYDLSDMVPDWTVGVGLKWTIFDGLSREREHKSAKLKLAQVNEFEQKISEDIATGVEKYYQELQMNLEQIKELDVAYNFANEYYQVQEKSFKEGMTSSSELINANLGVIKIKTEKLKAMYQYDVSLAKLLEICGLSEKYLEYQKSTNAKTELFESKN